jgi:hypothetical protein
MMTHRIAPPLVDTEWLQSQIEKVARAYKCYAHEVELTYGALENVNAPASWGWGVRVFPEKKRWGRGYRVIRAASFEWGDTLELAVQESIRKAPFYVGETGT